MTRVAPTAWVYFAQKSCISLLHGSPLAVALAVALVLAITAKTTAAEIAASDIIDSAHAVVNYMEATRKIPPTVTVGTEALKPAQYLAAATTVIESLLQTPNLSKPPIPIYRDLLEPPNPYPSADLLGPNNGALYTAPLKPGDYAELVRQVSTFLSMGVVPTIIEFRGGQIRYPELLYFVSSLLRFHKFFNALPLSHSLQIISPEGLVPWTVPPGLERYTGVVGRAGYTGKESFRYYARPGHYYYVYALARQIIGSETDPFAAGNLLYNWARNEGWLNVGYFAYSQPQFTGAWWSSYEWLRFRKGTSGTPRLSMQALMRAVNLPHAWSEVLFIDGRGWINAEVHAAYGSNPCENQFVYYITCDAQGNPLYPPPEPEEYPHPGDPFISTMRQFMAEAQRNLPPITKAIFINPTDVVEYGPKFIVAKVASGGLDTIIITVKNTDGKVYFSTRERAYVRDLLGPLIDEARRQNIKVYAALSVLADLEMARAHDEWRQRADRLDYPYPLDFISPCVQEYKAHMEEVIKDLVTHYDVDGVVLGSLYFNGFGAQSPELVDVNPACVAYSTSLNWHADLIRSYAQDLAGVIKDNCPSCTVKTLSWPIDVRMPIAELANPDQWYMGHQNLMDLSGIGDGIVLPFEENGWLQAPGFKWPVIATYLRGETGKTPGVSLYLSEEWEFTPEFYNGVIQYAARNGVDFIALHTPLSFEGEYGFGFDRTQFKKGTFHERAKVVDSLPGYTSGIAGCRHNLSV